MIGVRGIKNAFLLMLAAAMIFSLSACGAKKDGGEADKKEKTKVTVFAAASMKPALEELEASYEKSNPDVDIVLNTDSSGALMTQIKEGAPCDIFFSAAQKQMDELEKSGAVIEGTRSNVLNNQLVVITQPDSKTAVTGLANIGQAKSIALADGSVPVGKYTRKGLIALNLLGGDGDPADITTEQISAALGGVEISEQGNVSKVLTAVEEGSCEVGTVYLSDTYGHEDKVKIIERVPNKVTGDIIYPIARIANPDADDAVKEAADLFLSYITSDEADELYKKHLFNTDVK